MTIRAGDKRDIRESDLAGLFTEFYATLEGDELLARYFADLDMEAHIPRIVDFWSTILFGTRRYSGNAFLPHQQLPDLSAAHFTRWLGTLEATVDARYRGPSARELKNVAHRIAYTMQLRLGIPPESPYPT